MGTAAKAQELSFDAGYLFSTLSEYDNGSKFYSEASNGAFAGASCNFTIVEGLGVAPGLYYSFLTNRTVSTAVQTANFSEHALNLPVLLNYTLEFGHADLYFYAGPTFQCGLSSKYRYVETSQERGAETIVAVADNYQDLSMSRFNVFIGGGIGAVLNGKIRVTLGYDHGLLNLYKDEESKLRDYRSNVKLTLAYLLF